MNQIQFDCPGCGQTIETPEDAQFEQVKCPTCQHEFFPDKTRLVQPAPAAPPPESASPAPTPPIQQRASRLAMFMIFGLIAIILVIALVKKAEGPKEKTWREFSNEAEPMMLAEASNHIVGFRRMLHAYVDGHGDYKNPNVWTGNVEAEYINPIGGVSVTNVLFKFNLDPSSDGNILFICSYYFKKDLKEQFPRHKAQYEAELKAAGNPR